MEIVVKNVEDGIILEVEGRVDTITNEELQRAILDAFRETTNLTLDFEKVSYVSSAGLRALLIGQKTSQSKGGSMTLVNVAPTILKVLQMAGFDGILSIE